MNLFKAFLFLSITCLFQSCQTPEEETKQIVNRFLSDINNPQGSTFNKNDVTDEFGKYLFDNRTYNLEDWNFITGVDSDSIIFVQASSNSLTQEFRLAKRQGTWKISDSKNLIATNYDIELVEKKWADYSYLSQVAILKDLREHLQLKVIVPGYEAFLGKSRKGQLRIVNNSSHDVKNVRVLIEHFDINGISVNNDEEYILYPIRKGGYRDVTWYSTDCENCERQEFKIHFINEAS